MTITYDANKDGFFSTESETRERKKRDNMDPNESFDVENPDKLEKQIGQIIVDVDCKRLALHVVASRVCQLERALAAVAAPPRLSIGHLSELLANLACSLKASGNMALAEVIIARAYVVYAADERQQRFPAKIVGTAAELLRAKGKHREAAALYRTIVDKAQKQFQPESIVFRSLYKLADNCMETEQFKEAADAYVRAEQMQANRPELACIQEDTSRHQAWIHLLFKLGHLPVQNRCNSDIEVEYDRVAKERQRYMAELRKAEKR